MCILLLVFFQFYLNLIYNEKSLGGVFTYEDWGVWDHVTLTEQVSIYVSAERIVPTQASLRSNPLKQ